MSNTATMMGLGSGAGGVKIADAFSTQLYSGSSANRNIVNDIDLDGHGGMIWTKVRTTNFNHVITDTEQGLSPYLVPNATSAADNGGSDTVTSFNSDGYSLGVDGQWYWNKSGYNFVSWTWRKAPKFFDVVTWTGSGVAGRTVSHNLGSVPAMMIVKSTSTTGQWAVYHHSTSANPQKDYLLLNQSAAAYLNQDLIWNNTSPTATEFTLGSNTVGNGSGVTYVAYLFAHNEDLIQCGSFTMGTTVTVDLGFEPQWLMVKKASGDGQWMLVDTTRGWTATNDQRMLYANLTNAEGDATMLYWNSTGFTADSTGTGDFIYMAIKAE
tara:strand:- start:41 stop:1012 length:972 start_codon:yes stop_codon:yes gene_type:complete